MRKIDLKIISNLLSQLSGKHLKIFMQIDFWVFSFHVLQNIVNPKADLNQLSVLLFITLQILFISHNIKYEKSKLTIQKALDSIKFSQFNNHLEAKRFESPGLTNFFSILKLLFLTLSNMSSKILGPNQKWPHNILYPLVN